jgi:hypothetical protein
MATFPSKVNYVTGDVLTATNMNDIGGAINLLDGAQYAAGKNKIINGDFSINQRAFTSTTTTGTYGFDRWKMDLSGATGTYSAQTFTPGTAPVAGYESTNFARLAVTVGNDQARLGQPIEDVRTFAGQTVTLSFWAKGTNPTTAGNLTARLSQNFGTGGSPSAEVTTAQQTFVLTANWTRYSLTFAIPSISGKTIGTTPNTSSLSVFIGQGSSVSADAWTLDLWGVQLEEADTASPFQTATGTIQGELAACQRYYVRFTAVNSGASFGGIGSASSTTNARIQFSLPATMRVIPTAVESANTAVFDQVGQTNTNAAVTLSGQETTNFVLLNFPVASGLTQYRPYVSISNGSGTGYVGLSAEFS